MNRPPTQRFVSAQEFADAMLPARSRERLDEADAILDRKRIAIVVPEERDRKIPQAFLAMACLGGIAFVGVLMFFAWLGARLLHLLGLR